jgi:hypothetical protein
MVVPGAAHREEAGAIYGDARVAHLDLFRTEDREPLDFDRVLPAVAEG